MAIFRIVERPDGRTAVFDQYARCIELFDADVSKEEVAAVITARDQTGEYAPRHLEAHRIFDTSTQVWSETQWPAEE